MRIQIVVDEAREGGEDTGRSIIVGISFLVRADILGKVIETADRRQSAAVVIGELQFLAELVLVDVDEDVANLERARVDVDVIARVELPVSRDRLQRQSVRQVVGERSRNTRNA